MTATVWARYVLGGVYEFQTYWQLWPTLFLFVAVYALLGLYPAVGLSVPEEIRRVFTATTLVYLLLGSTTFLFKEAETYSRAIFLVAWRLVWQECQLPGPSCDTGSLPNLGGAIRW